MGATDMSSSLHFGRAAAARLRGGCGAAAGRLRGGCGAAAGRGTTWPLPTYAASNVLLIPCVTPLPPHAPGLSATYFPETSQHARIASALRKIVLKTIYEES